MVKTGATFADAAAEWLRYIEHDRGRKPSTVAGYRAILRAQLLPAFGDQALEAITTATIERWLESAAGSMAMMTAVRPRPNPEPLGVATSVASVIDLGVIAVVVTLLAAYALSRP